MESEGFGVSDDVCPKSVLGCCQVLLYNCRCSSSFFLGTVFGVVVLWVLGLSVCATTLAYGTVNRQGAREREKVKIRTKIKNLNTDKRACK